MDKETESQPHEEGSDIDYRPAWPQRPPGAGQARPAGLDPSGSPRVKSSQSGDPDDSAAWTSHPTSYDLSEDEPNDLKATRELPVVDRSRFDIGRQPQK